MAVGSTPRDSGNIPLGCGGSPGDTTPQQIQLGVEYTDGNSNITGPIMAALSGDVWKASYRASGTVVPVTGATDLITIIGSSTKTIQVVRIIFSGTITTAAINGSVLIIKRSTADTAGTSTAPTAIALDSNDAAATAVLAAYTANPSLGTTVGTIASRKYLYPIAASGSPEKLVFDWSLTPAKQPTLRGVAQQLALNLNAVAFASAGSVDYEFEWTEK